MTIKAALPHLVSAEVSHSWISRRRLSALIGANPAIIWR
jgi:hypothetical protein